MSSTLPQAWREILGVLDFAFQPIATFADGRAYGFEALLRGHEAAGFSSIASVFDAAFEDGALCAFDHELRRKAFRKFASAAPTSAKLFFNLDNRLLELPGHEIDSSLSLAEESGILPSRLVFEISELHEPDEESFERVVSAYRTLGFRIALDDFGSGYAGLKLLLRSQPDIVKIDRYFVGGLGEDPRKASFLTRVVGMAHLMGITVVAEGVETAQELRSCAEAGCDLVQGYLIGRPSLETNQLRACWPGAVQDTTGDRRSEAQAGKVQAADLLSTEAIGAQAGLLEVLARFRKEPETDLIPIVNAEGEPLGVYREKDFRPYVYSPYGIALLEHLRSEAGPKALMLGAPCAAIGTDLARTVEHYSISSDSGGVVFTEGGRYAGVLPAERLLSLVADRELAEARDQNPLTRLPGNLRVSEVCAERLARPEGGVAFAWFDFDNFKPFNDRYGFRNGDRVIMLFADIAKSIIRRPPGFIGHLGGDDFFACVDAPDLDEALAPLKEVAQRFKDEVLSFYSPEDRERGWIEGKDRSGRKKRMDLLSVSLAVVVQGPGSRLDADGLSEALALLKKEAKASPKRFALKAAEAGAPVGHANPGFPVFRPGLLLQ